MMPLSEPTSVEQYLAALPEDRRAVISAVRQVIQDSLPAGYEESLRWGMISYELPLASYSDTYNGQPLMYAALAAQKQYYALYLTCAYQDPARSAKLAEAFATAGKKLNMGKSCLRFRRLEDLPLAVIAEFIAATPPEAFIASYKRVRES